MPISTTLLITRSPLSRPFAGFRQACGWHATAADDLGDSQVAVETLRGRNRDSRTISAASLRRYAESAAAQLQEWKPFRLRCRRHRSTTCAYRRSAVVAHRYSGRRGWARLRSQLFAQARRDFATSVICPKSPCPSDASSTVHGGRGTASRRSRTQLRRQAIDIEIEQIDGHAGRTSTTGVNIHRREEKGHFDRNGFCGTHRNHARRWHRSIPAKSARMVPGSHFLRVGGAHPARDSWRWRFTLEHLNHHRDQTS